MKFEFKDFDKAHYASNIHQSATMLKWDTKGATHHLIIRAEFGKDVIFDAEYQSAIEMIENNQILSQKEISLSDKGYHFILLPKNHINGFQFSVSPATYAVFCCEYNSETDTCILYVPNAACLYQCNIAATINIRLEKEEAKKSGLFRIGKKGDGKTYYIATLPLISNYKDGFLYYTYDGYKYNFPITKAMLNKPIAIPAFGDKKPIIYSCSNNGYTIEITERN